MSQQSNRFDANKPLSDAEIVALPDKELFEYLDSKAEYLKQFSEPLDSYSTKQFASITKGGVLTDEELKNAKKIGQVGNNYRADRISAAATASVDLGVKVKKRGNKKWIE